MEERLSAWASELAHLSYEKLLSGFWPALLAALLFSAALAAFCWYRAKERPSDEERSMRTAGFTAIALVLWQLALVMNAPAGRIGTFCLAALALLAVAAVVLMMRGVPLGVALSLLHFWAGALLLAVPSLRAIYRDRAAIETFEASQRLPICVASDVLAMGTLLLVLLLGVGTALLLGEWRRMLNAPAQEEEAEEPSLVRRKVSAALANGLGSVKKLIASALVLVVLLLIPSFFASAGRYLTAGSAARNNAFIDCIKEYLAEPSVRADAAYADRLLGSYDDLWDYNCRIFNVKTRAVRRADLTFFMLHSDAAYRQLLAMSNVYDAIAADDAEATLLAGQYFDATNTLMLMAAPAALREATTISDHPFSSLRDLVVDAFRFYTSFLPLTAIAALLLLAALLLGALALRAARREEPTPFEQTRSLTQPVAALRLPKGVWAAIALAAVLAVGAVLAPEAAEGADEWDAAAREAFFDAGSSVMQGITLNESALRERFPALEADLLRQEEAVDRFVSLAADGAEEYQSMAEDAALLREVLAALRLSDGAPSAELRREYLRLESGLMLDAMQGVIRSTIAGLAGIS